MASVSAEIVSVGTELLLGQIVDTNAPALAVILADCGIACRHRSTVGDNLERAVKVLTDALDRADVVITVGGLGPTGDDLTRDAIAAALGDRLVEVPEMADQLREFFASRGIEMVDSNLRQAMRPESARFINNPYGTAPGLICEKNGKVVIALPGPPSEFLPMASGPVKGYLSRLAAGHEGGGLIIHSRTLRVIGIGESSVEARVRHLMDGENPTVAPYAKTGEVHLRLTARAATIAEADRLIDPVEAQIRAILGDAVYGIDGVDLAAAVLGLLAKLDQTVASAESVTGGLIGGRLTSVPGSSRTFRGGITAYTPAVKRDVLSVPGEVLDRYGPVSAETAAAMAEEAKRKFNVDWGVSSTGNAGPTADVDGKPVGLVFIGISGPVGTETVRAEFRGQRENIRERAVQLSLDSLRRQLLRLRT